MSITAETKETIRTRMLARVKDTYDRTEGSFFWDMIDPVAAEEVAVEERLIQSLDNSFVATATGDDLDCVVFDRKGMMRKEGTKSIGTVKITGVAGKDVPVGITVSADTVEFRTTESGTIGTDGTVELPIMCTVRGSRGNVAAGTIKTFAVSYTGLYSVTNERETSGGTDAETDTALRERCYSAMRDPGTSGNVAHYKEWALTVPGVGDARVIPVWNGNGTVKVVIVGTDKSSVGSEVVAQAKAYIEAKRPIGANVTVESAEEVDVNIVADVVLDGTVTLENVIKSFTERVESYLRDKAFNNMSVSYTQIGALLIGTDGVEDYTDMLLNGESTNIKFGTTEVGVVGTVDLAEISNTMTVNGVYNTVSLKTSAGYTSDRSLSATYKLRGNNLTVVVDVSKDRVSAPWTEYTAVVPGATETSVELTPDESGAAIKVTVKATVVEVPETITVYVYRSTSNVTLTMTNPQETSVAAIRLDGDL